MFSLQAPPLILAGNSSFNLSLSDTLFPLSVVTGIFFKKNIAKRDISLYYKREGSRFKFI